MLSRLMKPMTLRLAALLFALIGTIVVAATPSRADEYTAKEIIDSGHRFFGATSGISMALRSSVSAS